jgi:glycosyltransferase involved in cell wall biosynthesis
MLVSVILPTYNRVEWLRQSIDSVLRQTHADLELIVVDDGSSDGTQAFVRTLPGPVRYVRQPNAGDAAARNRGLDLARGDLIAFQDDDDLWHPDKLKLQLELLRQRPEVGLVCSGRSIISQRGEPLPGGQKKHHEGTVTAALFQSQFITTPSVLLRREVARQVGRFDAALRVCSDYDYWLRASLVCPFAAVARPLVDVRRSPGSLSKSRAAESAATQLLVLERFHQQHQARCGSGAAVRARLARLAFRVGRHYHDAGDHARARDYFRRALGHRLSPRAAWAWARQDWLLRRGGPRASDERAA